MKKKISGKRSTENESKSGKKPLGVKIHGRGAGSRTETDFRKEENPSSAK